MITHAKSKASLAAQPQGWRLVPAQFSREWLTLSFRLCWSETQYCVQPLPVFAPRGMIHHQHGPCPDRLAARHQYEAWNVRRSRIWVRVYTLWVTLWLS